jgi:hypothetical protein
VSGTSSATPITNRAVLSASNTHKEKTAAVSARSNPSVRNEVVTAVKTALSPPKIESAQEYQGLIKLSTPAEMLAAARAKTFDVKWLMPSDLDAIKELGGGSHVKHSRIAFARRRLFINAFSDLKRFG